MSKLQELKQETERIFEIFINAKENFSYCYYLHVPSTKDEAEYLEVDQDLIFIRHSLWRLSVIELTKLFSDNNKTHKLNLNHLLSKMKPSGYYSELNMDPVVISSCEKMIADESEPIARLILLRDKIYAHTDPNKNEFRSIEIYFNQIEKLLDLAATILVDIHEIVLGTNLIIRMPTYDRENFELVKVLADAHRKSIQEIT